MFDTSDTEESDVQIHPDLRELMETMNRMSILPADFEGRNKVQKWWDFTFEFVRLFQMDCLACAYMAACVIEMPVIYSLCQNVMGITTNKKIITM